MDYSGSNMDFRTLLPRGNGFVFKFVKKNNQFIHTFIEGNLLTKMGITPSMIIGKTLFDFLPFEDASRKNLIYQKAWNGSSINYEGKFKDKFYIASLNPLIVNSKVIEVNGIAIDITIQKKDERKLLEMEKLSVIGGLAAGIAHEIRNPLTSIKGFTQMIKESIQDEKIEKYLTIMLDDMDRISNIVNEFMFIAKPKETLELKQVDINSLISNVIHFMEPQSNFKSISIKTYFYKQIIALCDPNQLKQVLINLLQNAIEASKDNTNIDVTLRESGKNEYMIQVADHGYGMPKERLDKLFEPFFTTKEKGTGLGLMMCKRIIETHHGTILIDSVEGEGTTVRITLPLQQVQEQRSKDTYLPNNRTTNG